MDVRIGIIQSTKELDVEVGDDVTREDVLAEIEAALADAERRAVAHGSPRPPRRRADRQGRLRRSRRDGRGPARRFRRALAPTGAPNRSTGGSRLCRQVARPTGGRHPAPPVRPGGRTRRTYHDAVIDYHVHLWPHAERAEASEQRLERLAAYCEQAAQRGRRRDRAHRAFLPVPQGRAAVGDFWKDGAPTSPFAATMGAYFDHHATADLDAYVTAAAAARDAGPPGRRRPRGRLLPREDGRRSPGCWRAIPSTSCSVPCTGSGSGSSTCSTTRSALAEWDRRYVEEVWRRYTEALEELAGTRTCDVLAHPDFVKLAGRRPSAATLDECHDRMAEAAAASGMAAEISSAGWRTPVGEQFPATALLERFAARGVPVTTASDSHGPGRVGERAGELSRLAAAAGYHTVRAFRARHGHDVPLEATPDRGGRGTSPMTSADLARRLERAVGRRRDHLEQLMGSWGMLADLSFSDLVLYVPRSATPPPGADPTRRGDRLPAAVRRARPDAAYDEPDALRVDLVGEVADEGRGRAHPRGLAQRGDLGGGSSLQRRDGPGPLRVHPRALAGLGRCRARPGVVAAHRAAHRRARARLPEDLRAARVDGERRALPVPHRGRHGRGHAARRRRRDRPRREPPGHLRLTERRERTAPDGDRLRRSSARASSRSKTRPTPSRPRSPNGSP